MRTIRRLIGTFDGVPVAVLGSAADTWGVVLRPTDALQILEPDPALQATVEEMGPNLANQLAAAGLNLGGDPSETPVERIQLYVRLHTTVRADFRIQGTASRRIAFAGK